MKDNVTSSCIYSQKRLGIILNLMITKSAKCRRTFFHRRPGNLITFLFRQWVLFLQIFVQIVKELFYGDVPRVSSLCSETNLLVVA